MNEGQHIKRIERLVKSNQTVQLNAGFEIVSIVHWHKATEKVTSNEAQILTARTNGDLVRSQYLTFPRPLIIVLNKYSKVFKPIVSEDCSVSKKTIFSRDEYKCVYCDDVSQLTLDHIIPKSKGGGNTWNNLVTSCSPCNSKKADKSISEMGWEEPIIPSHNNMNMKYASIDNAVKNYLFSDEYLSQYGMVN